MSYNCRANDCQNSLSPLKVRVPRKVSYHSTYHVLQVASRRYYLDAVRAGKKSREAVKSTVFAGNLGNGWMKSGKE